MNDFGNRLIGALSRAFIARTWQGWIVRFGILMAIIALIDNGHRAVMNEHDHAGMHQGYGVHTLYLIAAPLTLAMLGVFLYMGQMQRKLARLAMTDVLTGLPNRRSFLDAAERTLTGDEGVLMMIDIDHFKRINDEYGHAVGDLCLQAMAQHLKSVVNPDDVLARIGGEEFAAILVGGTQDRAKKTGAAIAEGVEIAAQGGPMGLKVTTSVGAVFVGRIADISDAMRDADIALYAAKRNGRAQLQFFEDHTPFKAQIA